MTASPLTWLLLAAGLAVAGAGPAPAVSAPRSRPGRRPLSLRTLRALAAGGSVAICVALFGVGHGALAAAAVAPAAATVIGIVHARPGRARASPSLALALDLMAVALRAGQPLDTALLLAAPAAGDLADALARVGGLLRLGAEPAVAWAALDHDPSLATLAATARRSAASGVRLAAAFEEQAVDVRARLRSAAEGRAHRVGVLAAAPLGLCFLPSFVCLGIVPALIGLARTSLG